MTHNAHFIVQKLAEIVNMGKVAIVTGGNKGIGYETVRQGLIWNFWSKFDSLLLIYSEHRGLLKSGEFEAVYLTARNPKLGEASRETLKNEEKTEVLEFHQLDIADENSIQNFKAFIEEKHGGYDVLGTSLNYQSKNSI